MCLGVCSLIPRPEFLWCLSMRLHTYLWSLGMRLHMFMESGNETAHVYGVWEWDCTRLWSLGMRLCSQHQYIHMHTHAGRCEALGRDHCGLCSRVGPVYTSCRCKWPVCYGSWEAGEEPTDPWAERWAFGQRVFCHGIGITRKSCGLEQMECKLWSGDMEERQWDEEKRNVLNFYIARLCDDVIIFEIVSSCIHDTYTEIHTTNSSLPRVDINSLNFYSVWNVRKRWQLSYFLGTISVYCR